MDLARSEDRSVSELIRSIVGAYMQAKDATAPMTKQRINQMAKSPKTWSLAAALTLVTGTLILVPAAQAEKSYTVNVEITDNKEGSFLLSSAKRHTMTAYAIKQTDHFVDLVTHNSDPSIQGADNALIHSSDYNVLVKVQDGENGTSFVHFKICKKTEAACEPVAEPSLQFTPDDGARIEIGSIIKDRETGEEAPYDLITIDISQDDT